jgi:O-antigen/teichoic acid export membrane protein
MAFLGFALLFPVAIAASRGRLPELLGVHEVASGVAITRAFLVFFVLFAINLPAALIQKIQLGLQQGYVAASWQVVSSFVTLTSVPVAIAMHQGLPTLVGCLFGSQVLANVLNTAISHYRTRRFKVRASYVSGESLVEVFRTGFLFLVLQLTVAFAYQSDGLIVARYLGPVQAGDYLVAQKVFSIVVLLVSSATAGLWSAFGDAAARDDKQWLYATLTRSLGIVLLFATLVAVAVALSFNQLTRLWLHANGVVPPGLVACFAAWSVIDAVGSVTGVFMNGLNVIRLQVIVASALGAVAVLGKIILVRMLGATGVVLATIFAYLAISAPVQLVFFRSYFKRHSSAAGSFGT